MATSTARIFVYRLTFESYLKDLNDEPSVESMKDLADELFDLIDEKLSFQDGKGRPVEADNLTKFGKEMLYFRMEKQSQRTLNAEKSHKENHVMDFPYFSVVFDFRHSDDYILMGIEHKSAAFQDIDYVRKNIEGCLDELFRKKQPYNVRIRPVSIKDKFWKKVRLLCRAGKDRLQSIGLQIPNIKTSFPLSVNERERMMLEQFIKYGMGIRATYANFDYGLPEDASVSEVEEHFDMMSHIACKNGYEIKATLASGRVISSAKDSAASYPLDKSIIADVNDEVEEKLPFQEQKKKLSAWFDEIYPDLKLIEQEEQNAGKNKRHIKK